MKTVSTTPFDSDGSPRFGTWHGSFKDTELRGHIPGPLAALRRIRRRKAWHWFSCADDHVAIGGAIVDLQTAGKIFIWVFDRDRRRLIDHSKIRPAPLIAVSSRLDGRVATYRGARDWCKIERLEEHVNIEGRVNDIELQLIFETTSDDAVSAVAPVEGLAYGVNVTEKRTAMKAHGRIHAAGKTWLMESGMGMMDYTHGLLHRDTSWRWAIASGLTPDGVPVGFNACEGFNQGLENAIWNGEQPLPLSGVTFRYNPNRPEESWRVVSDDGLLDVTMSVEGVRSEDVLLGPLISKYVQPLGQWHGRVGSFVVDRIYGVAEDHIARW